MEVHACLAIAEPQASSLSDVRVLICYYIQLAVYYAQPGEEQSHEQQQQENAGLAGAVQVPTPTNKL